MAPKACKTCSALKPMDQYHRASTAKDGHQNECKVCSQERLRAWRAANAGGEKVRAQKEKARVSAAAYYEANKGAILARERAYFSTHEGKAEKAAADRAYRDANKERLKLRQQAYQRREREAINAYRRATAHRYAAAKAATVAHRRASKLRATPLWADRNAIRAVYAQAKAVQEQSGAKVHVDHIVPLVSPLVCGLHVQNNLQVLPYLENHSKSNRYWPDMPAHMEPDL